jgi:hypothetical protein
VCFGSGEKFFPIGSNVDAMEFSLPFEFASPIESHADSESGKCLAKRLRNSQGHQAHKGDEHGRLLHLASARHSSIVVDELGLRSPPLRCGRRSQTRGGVFCTKFRHPSAKTKAQRPIGYARHPRVNNNTRTDRVATLFPLSVDASLDRHEGHGTRSAPLHSAT